MWASDKRLPTLSIDTRIRFRSAAERASFSSELADAVRTLVSRYQESFIASTRQTQTWEEVLLSVDGIVVSGGNTLNQQAIWKAHGIDIILKQAWDRGIVLGGAARRL